MATHTCLPQVFKIVDGTTGPVTSNGGITCDSVSLKNVHRAWIVANFHQAAGHATVVQPMGGATVATATNAITFTTNWWLNTNVAATDTLVAQTDATAGTADAGVTNQLMVIEIDPAELIMQNVTYDCLGCTVSNSAAANNFVQVTYFLENRYQGEQPPAAITD